MQNWISFRLAYCTEPRDNISLVFSGPSLINFHILKKNAPGYFGSAIMKNNLYIVPSLSKTFEFMFAMKNHMLI
jgi:hypothetical protein